LIVWLNWEATNRILNPPPKINAMVMLITAVVGLVSNVISLCTLHTFTCKHDHSHDHSHDDYQKVDESSKVEETEALPQTLMSVFTPRGTPKSPRKTPRKNKKDKNIPDNSAQELSVNVKSNSACQLPKHVKDPYGALNY